MAFQMAMIHPGITEAILNIASEPSWRESLVDRVDYLPYWVIDAVGECKLAENLIGLLSRATRHWPLRIFVTSRPPEVSFHGAYSMEITSEKISEEDTNSDIALFLRAQPGGCQPTAEAIAALIKKSNGCFLWAYLVQQELRSAHTKTSVDKVLQSTPSDMTQLYESILKKMEDSPDQKRKETEALLHWVVCACRPLVTNELQRATEADLKDEINDMEKLVADRCGNLVVVDSAKRVKLVHQTIREVLTSKTLDSPFRVDLGVGHRRLAILQLRHLCGNDHAQNNNRGPSARPAHERQPTARSAQACAHLEQSPLAQYAAGHVFQHIAKIPSSLCDDDVFEALFNFFSSPGVLWWIGYLAGHDSLQTIFSAGKTVASVVNRRKQRNPPPLHVHNETALLERWSNDLVRLVPKFGRRLRASPSSIDMTPPFCPPASAIRQQFCLPRKGLSVQGLSSRDWDDCIATITFESPPCPSCVAVSDKYVAYGARNGKVHIYEDGTFQEWRVLVHGEQYVRCLAFSAGGAYLASAVGDALVLWRTDTWIQIQKIPLPSECTGVTFRDDGNVVRAGLRSNEVLSWDMNGGPPNDEGDELVNWTVGLEEEMGDISQRQPSLVAFCPHRSLMAAVYRRTHILLWDLKYSQFEDLCVKGLGFTSKLGQSQARGPGEDGYESPGAADSTKPSLIIHGATGTETAFDIAFSSAPDSTLMAVTYGGGDLCTYDIEKRVALATQPGVHAYRVAITPDGRTVATADPQGGIRLFDAGSLKCLYYLDRHAFSVNSLTFTADGLKLVEVRGRQSRVWSPSVLLRQDAEEDVSDTVSLSTPTQEVDYNVIEPAVTALRCAWSSALAFVFLRRDNGTVLVQDMAGDEPLQHLLFTMPQGAPVLSMHYDDETGLLSTGSTTCVVCHKITKPARPKLGKWVASHTLIRAESSSVIHQVLGSGTHSRLLVSSEEGDLLWSFKTGSASQEHTAGGDSMIGKRAAETEQRNHRAKRWASHPTQRSLLILAEGATIEMRYWATFATVVSWKADVGAAHMTRLLCRDDPSMPFFLTVADEGEGGGSRRHSVGAADLNRRTIQVWGLQDLVEPSPHVSPSPPSSSLGYRPRPICTIDARDIDLGEVIGLHFGHLVYLNTDYYVCSLPIHAPRSSPNDAQAACRRSSSSLLATDSPLLGGSSGGSHGGNATNTDRTSNSTLGDTSVFGDTCLAAAEGLRSEDEASADDRTRPTAHFFLPHDWVGPATKTDVDINKHGEVFFAKRGDVAVVKRGLSSLKEGARLDYRRSSSPGSARFPPRPSPWPPGRGLQSH